MQRQTKQTMVRNRAASSAGRTFVGQQHPPSFGPYDAFATQQFRPQDQTYREQQRRDCAGQQRPLEF